jgi:hypothetical protein
MKNVVTAIQWPPKIRRVSKNSWFSHSIQPVQGQEDSDYWIPSTSSQFSVPATLE